MSAFILMLSGLTLLLSSCTEKMIVPDRPDSGKKVALKFAFGGVTDNGSEVVARNQSDISPDTVVVPLGDGLSMYATLEPVQKSAIQATSNTITSGTMLRIVAYENGTVYSGKADYKVSNALTLESDKPLEVSPGEYRFVAYSHNSKNPMPVHSESFTNIDPETDLLWGRYPALGDSLFSVAENKSEAITIRMSHILSRVTIVASTENISGNIAITGFEKAVTIPGKKVNLTVENGELTPQGDTDQNFSWPAFGSTVVTSETRIAYTGNAPTTTVRIPSLSLSGYDTPFTNLTAVFEKQLKPGVSYTLKVNFKKDGPGVSADLLYFIGDVLHVGKWGAGNPVNSGNIAYFKFGSVIGFSNSPENWNADAVKFNTTGADYGTYRNILTYDKWNATSFSGPSVSDPVNYHTGARVKEQGRGDPCKLAGLSASQIRQMTAEQIDAYNSGWRLPTREENGRFVGGYYANNPSSGDNYQNATRRYWTNVADSPDVPAGTARWPGGWFPVLDPANGTTLNPAANFIPAAGWRNSSGVFANTSPGGNYWTSTPYSNIYGYYLGFHSNNVYPVGSTASTSGSDAGNQNNGHNIRCVRQ
jgi:hypothetical protein